MSEIKKDGSGATEEKDWAAAKAAFENLKSNKPRPVSISWNIYTNKKTHMALIMYRRFTYA